MEICDCRFSCGGRTGLVDDIGNSCNAFTGPLWPANLRCFEADSPPGPLDLPVTNTRLEATAFVQTDRCCIDRAAALWGHIIPVPHVCGGDTVCGVPPGPNQLVKCYFNESPGAQPWFRVFDWLQIRSFNGLIRSTGGGAYYSDPAEVRLRNIALIYLRQRLFSLGLNEMSSARRDSTAVANHNQDLDLFRASWNLGPGDVLPFGQLPEVFPLTARLRNAGVTLSNVRWVVRGVLIDMSIALRQDVKHPVGTFPPLSREWLLYVSAAVRVQMFMGVQAALADVRFHSGDYGRPYPRFDGDQIIFRDDLGRPVHPPRTVTWEGDLGPLTDPAWNGLDTNSLLAGTGQAVTCETARLISPTTIPARGSHADSNPDGSDKQIWIGSMQIEVPVQVRTEYGCP
jgi:hypothetical protein